MAAGAAIRRRRGQRCQNSLCQFLLQRLGGGGGGSAFGGPIFNQKSFAGVNDGEGYASVRLLMAVPEPSTWAMALAGFGGLGWLARCARESKPA